MPSLGMARSMMLRIRHLVVASLLLAPSGLPAAAEDERNGVDTEHMFGFLTGSDVGDVGDREVESETNGRFGRRTGSYSVLTQTASLEYVPFENVRITPSASLDRHAVSGVA